MISPVGSTVSPVGPTAFIVPEPPPTTNAIMDAQRARLAALEGPITLGGQPSGQTMNAVGTPGGTTLGVSFRMPADILATRVQNDWQKASDYRQEDELQWQQVHENYRGMQPRSPQELAMGIRSKVTMKVTRVKVAAALARLREIGFRWDVKPTAIPTLMDMDEGQLRARLEEDLAGLQDQDLASKIGAELNAESLMDDVRKLALDRSRRMKTRIKDDLQQDRFDGAYDQGLLEFCLYGSMAFKGPLTKKSTPGRWVRKGGAWSFYDHDGVTSYAPTTLHVSVWDFYPSPGCWCVDKADYLVVRHVCNQAEVMELAEAQEGYFRRDKIDLALADGTARWSPLSWEQSVMAANRQMNPAGLVNRHVLLEWWGWMSVEELKGYGADIPKVKRFNVKSLQMEDVEPANTDVMAANVWVMGNHVIKAMSVDLKPRRLPFYVVPYEKVPKRLFGQGPAWMMSDWQRVLDTTYRAMLDNMGISAIPMGWYDKSRVKDQDVTLHCGKMFAVEDVEDITQPPVFFFNAPNNTAQLKMMADIANKNIQESTSMPDMVQAMTGAGGHNRTSSGLSMLGGWADAATRSVARNIDQELAVPFITAMYFWEMQLCRDESIKGDFEVVALGVESVVQDEVLLQRIEGAIGVIAQDPEAGFIIDKGQMYNRFFEKLGFKDEGFVYSPTVQKQKRDEAQQAQMAMDEEKAKNAAKYQPEMTEKDANLKFFSEIPDQALGLKVAVAKVVGEKLGLLTPEANKAADIVIDHTMEHLGALPLPAPPKEKGSKYTVKTKPDGTREITKEVNESDGGMQPQ